MRFVGEDAKNTSVYEFTDGFMIVIIVVWDMHNF